MGDFIRYIILGFLAVAFSACGRPTVYNVGQFQTYVDQFEAASRQQGAPVKVDNLVIQFGEMQSASERGACEVPLDGTPTITIKKSTWDNLAESDRRELLFHEMGHCVLYRIHNSEMNGDGTPKSIMNPYGVQGQVFEQKQGEYLKELFGSSVASN